MAWFFVCRPVAPVTINDEVQGCFRIVLFENGVGTGVIVEITVVKRDRN